MTFDPYQDIIDTPAMPNDYATALETVAPNITSMMATQTYPGEDWTQTLTRLLTVITATQQQRQLLQVQVERARQGLPPLDASQYAVGVNANVGISRDAKLFVGIGIAAIVAVLLLGQFRRR